MALIHCLKSMYLSLNAQWDDEETNIRRHHRPTEELFAWYFVALANHFSRLKQDISISSLKDEDLQFLGIYLRCDLLVCAKTQEFAPSQFSYLKTTVNLILHLITETVIKRRELN
jgi:hypothetical protein